MAKVSETEGLAPRAIGDEAGDKSEGSGEGVRLKKELGVMNGVAIIVGVIVGSGIFVSPSMTLRETGSKGMALIVWVLSGLVSMIGALCYAELGTMIPKSGGDYAYIGEAFGPLPAFLYLWAALFVLVPTGNAVTALILAENILQPLWSPCKPAREAVCLIAAVVTCFVTAINCYNVKWVTKVQDSFTAAKILALLVIFFASIGYMFEHDTEKLQSMMEGTVTKPGNIAVAFYFGLFSYSGWNYLNFVTEELKDPHKNLPRAILISMPMVTLVYTLTNVALFAVLDSGDIMASDAVAVIFGQKILSFMSWIMPVFVALCTFGSLNGAIYASSRLFFVGARNGHLPLAISLIDMKRLTPVPSLIFMCLVTLVLLVFSDVEKLIVYVSAVEAIFTLSSIAGLLWMRYSRPKLMRPIRVNLILPIVYLIACTFLVVFSCVREPVGVGIGIAFIGAGVPVYVLFILWKNKPEWMQSACNSFTIACAKMFLSLPEDSKDL
ncbi:large neutral amino acids transporter small subunit 1 [Epargyreus clarus]|uniref:large neutral amino acids transporter small subunit 1 n=1 Tax=Epargyreus clarus TaxID=520877 RepID=UPI003C30AE3A